ncbi:histone-lysine N-methyltransferase SETMAR [Elysia marginata]|uniref:Histone-lysine N-methyltransferase SETMAR n=1 Tax=Elysia marginata TaxID=1093978 RepID=A0AAV4EBN1_9GAST|nr:histone-lysine N-methyltransferase SETMAR [Elysia marginata]
MEGMFNIDLLKQGETVISERYISRLRAVKIRLRRVWRDKYSILQHENVRPHTSGLTKDALRQMELANLPHPAYSPDLAPSNYYLFPQLKKYLKIHHYIGGSVAEWLARRTRDLKVVGSIPDHAMLQLP